MHEKSKSTFYQYSTFYQILNEITNQFHNLPQTREVMDIITTHGKTISYNNITANNKIFSDILS